MRETNEDNETRENAIKMENLIVKVRSYLNAKFYATNDAWLRECVIYYRQEHTESSDNEVIEFAMSQWQLSDLREISNENPCLPTNLAQEKCTTLRGHFVLQMDKVYDIGESKFKQLEKIRNVSMDNIIATEEATQNWEPKKKRMLHFHLTDGAQNITAIEYKPIRILNEKLLPGYKLIIKGPVTCRRGVIMLDETNVSGIGGEVETMLVSNAQENILARALNLPENPDPYNDAVKASVASAVEDVLFDDDFDIDMDAVELIEKRSQEEFTRTPDSPSINPSSNNRLDLLAGSRSVNRYVQPENKRIDDPTTLDVLGRHDTESDLLFDMIDETEFQQVLPVPPAPGNFGKTIVKNTAARVFPPQSSEFPDDEELELLENWPKPEIVEKKKIENFSSRRVLPQNPDFPDDEELELLENWPKPEIVEKKKIEKISSRHVLPQNPEFTDDDLLVITDSSTTGENWQNQKSKASKPMREISDMCKLKINTNTKSPATASTSKRANDLVFGSKKSEPAGIKRNASVLSPPVLKPPAEKIRCTQNTPKNKNNNRKITDYLKKDERFNISLGKTNISETISDLLNANVTAKAMRKRIKVRLTKYEKLVTNGEYWALNATITDATGNIDVAFASEILEQFLGFTVAEMKQKRKLKNPEIDDQLRKGFRNAEHNLKNLDAMLDVELVAGEKPKVIKVINITDEQRDVLYKNQKLPST